MSRTDFGIVWRCYGIPCFHFCLFFGLDLTIRRTFRWERLPSRLWHFFKSTMLKITWFTGMFNVCSQELTPTLTAAFWNKPNNFTILRTWINIRANLSWSFIMKPIANEGVCKDISCTKLWAFCWKNISPMSKMTFLIRLNIFLKSTVEKCFNYVVIFFETFVHVTGKITPHVNNYLWFLYIVQNLSNYQHVRCNLWCLIMAPAKLNWSSSSSSSSNSSSSSSSSIYVYKVILF